MPSRRRQISLTAPALTSASENPGRASRARSHSSRADSDCATTSGSCSSGGGRVSGGTGQVASPPTLSLLWLVARIRSAGHCRSRPVTRPAAASSTCSQLSTISSASLVRSCAAIVSASGRPGSSRTPSAEAAAAATRSGRATGASSTSHTPPGYRPDACCPALRASRVLPDPPGPVSVSRRDSPSSSSIVASSDSRPMNDVVSAGSQPGAAAGTDAGSGASATGNPAPASPAPGSPA